MLRKSVILSGPPGVGKSTIGRCVAAQLNLVFLDLDDVIEAHEGQSPAEIIRTRGEAALRRAEHSAIESLKNASYVVSLGGGTLTSAPARHAARSLGPVIGLTASQGLLEERLEHGVDRPLLAKGLSVLLAERGLSYRAVDRTVDASSPPEPVAEAIAEMANGLDVIDARFGDARSRIVIGEELFEAVSGSVASLEPQRPVLFVADEGVPAVLRETYARAVAKVAPMVIATLPGGEQVKTWSELGALLERAVAEGCGRQSVVVGLGGGATCDVAALAASLLGRGAPLVLVPSTLLAQVDASVGGKSAVNIGARNSVGTFHPATDVLVDTALPASQADADYRSGLAEMLKMGIIRGGTLFEAIVRDRRASRATIRASILAKVEIVAQDPDERGIRKVLNLGHTLGHALEVASDFHLLHGEAVAIGIASIARMSAERGWLSAAEKTQIIEGLAGADLPTSASMGLLEKAAEHLRTDKKGTATEVDLVCIRGMGKVAVERLSWAEAQADLVRNGGIE